MVKWRCRFCGKWFNEWGEYVKHLLYEELEGDRRWLIGRSLWVKGF